MFPSIFYRILQQMHNMANYREYQRIIRLTTPVSSASKTLRANPQLAIELSPGSPCCSSTHAHSHVPGNSTEAGHVVKEKKKITRTKTGCFCCRRRKKKCDERKPACSGCLRNNLQCVYPTEEELKKSSVLSTSPSSTSSRKIRKCSKVQDKFAATVLSEMKSSSFTRPISRSPRSPSQPVMCSPRSNDTTPNSSDIESPITSPALQPSQYTLTSSHSEVPFFNINSVARKRTSLLILEPKTSRQISVKSLLN